MTIAQVVKLHKSPLSEQEDISSGFLYDAISNLRTNIHGHKDCVYKADFHPLLRRAAPPFQNGVFDKDDSKIGLILRCIHLLKEESYASLHVYIDDSFWESNVGTSSGLPYQLEDVSMLFELLSQAQEVPLFYNRKTQLYLEGLSPAISSGRLSLESYLGQGDLSTLSAEEIGQLTLKAGKK